MGWLQRLLGIQPFDSEQYERVVCDRCTGIGYPRSSHARDLLGDRIWSVRCGKCNGKGYVVVKKPT